MLFFVKEKTAYGMRIRCWSSDLCSSDLKLELHLRAQLRVERRERFVEEQHRGPHDEAARERDALALPARHLIGHTAFEPAELHQFERLGNAVPDFAALHAGDLKAIGDIVGDAHMREEDRKSTRLNSSH